MKLNIRYASEKDFKEIVEICKQAINTRTSTGDLTAHFTDKNILL